MRKVILVDICNTLADVNSEINKVTGTLRPEGLYFHPAVCQVWFASHLDVFRNCKPINYAVEGLNKLAETFNIVYATARPEEAKKITECWLKKNGFPQGILEFSAYKPRLVEKYEVEFAIEDAPHEINQYQVAGLPVRVYAQDYNITFINRFTWKECF